MAASCEQFERGPTVGVDSSDGRAVSYGRSGLEFIDAAADVEQIEYINPFRRATPPRQRTDCEGGGRRVHGLCGQRVPPSTRILRSYTSTTVGRSRSRKFQSIDRSSQTTVADKRERSPKDTLNTDGSPTVYMRLALREKFTSRPFLNLTLTLTHNPITLLLNSPL